VNLFSNQSVPNTVTISIRLS